YFAAILPDGSLLLLTPAFDFVNSLVPFIKNVPLSNLNAPSFLSAQLPDGLPAGIYEFYVVVVIASADPGEIGNWLASAGTAISYVTASSNIDSYLYFKRGGTTVPQAATITFPDNSDTGTLRIDGKTIPGIYYTSGNAGSGCLGGGSGTSLTRCFAPPDLPNTILLCGPDPNTGSGEVLLYVMLLDPDNNLTTATASNYLSALQSEQNYSGGNVYTDCYGFNHSAWIRNYPNTNYYRWPDVITTYSATHVSGLLSAAALYSTPQAGNRYYEYIVVRPGPKSLEVWH
ncbi:MAG: hypothetical protein RL120_01940, partial [Gammaproteobacteria bacterium]